MLDLSNYDPNSVSNPNNNIFGLPTNAIWSFGLDKLRKSTKYQEAIAYDMGKKGYKMRKSRGEKLNAGCGMLDAVIKR